MPTELQLRDQLMDAYEHLYDYAYLRTHPLRWLVDAGGKLPHKEQASRLHRLLLDILDELDPGPGAPAFSREWRRHRIMVLRYTDGLDPDSIASRLAISRRTFYRDHDEALRALARIISSNKAVAIQEDAAADTEQAHPAPEHSRLEMARLEVARLARDDRLTSLNEVVQSVTPLVRELAGSKNVTVQDNTPTVASGVMVDRSALRQLLLSIVSHLLEDLEQGNVTISLDDSPQPRKLRVYASGDWNQGDGESRKARELRIAIIENLAKVQGIELQPLTENGWLCGFGLVFPASREPLILVIDDNEHTVELVSRYLAANGYKALHAFTAEEGVRLARENQPEAIILDLMMPNQDGWDVLQTLTNHAKTQRIPIMVCSILAAGELALSLGATLFLEKPITERALIAALKSLRL